MTTEPTSTAPTLEQDVADLQAMFAEHGLSTTTYFADEDLEVLEARGITQDMATAAGVRSILVREHLPEDLQWAWDRHGRGMLFSHRLLDGTVWHQYRPAHPKPHPETGELQKYIFQPGCQTGPFVQERRAHLAQQATRVMIVEGTVQNIAANEATPEGILVVGLAGCYGSVQNGVPDLAAFQDLIAPDAEVYICLDADMRTNPSVWDAANLLAGNLRMIPGAQVRFCRIPAGAKAGLDDWLARSRPEHRGDMIEGLLKEATAKPGARPKKRREAAEHSALDPVIDREACQIVMPEVRNAAGELIAARRVLLDAAIEIHRSRAIGNELDPEAAVQLEYDFLVHLRLGGARRTYEVNNIRPRDFRVRHILDSIDDGTGVNIHAYDRDEEDILRAIRTGSEQLIQVVQAHSGWYLSAADGDAVRYLDARGSTWAKADPDGSVRSGRDEGEHLARVSEVTGERQAFLDIRDLTDEQLAEACRAVTGVTAQATDSRAYTIAMATAAASVTGATPFGLPGVYGAYGAGKSWVMTLAMACFGPDMAHGDFEGTTGAIRAAGMGVHNALCAYDDVRDRGEEGKAAVEQTSGVIGLARRSIAQRPGSYSRRRLNKDDYTKVDRSDPSMPWFIITAETPALPGSRASSSLDRMILAEYPAEALGDEAFQLSAEAKTDGRYHRWGSLLVTRLAERYARGVDVYGTPLPSGAKGLPALFEAADRYRKAAGDELREGELAAETQRASDVAGTILYGIRVAASVLAEYLTAAEVEAWVARSRADLVAVSQAWNRRNRAEAVAVAERGPILELKDALASGRYILAERDGKALRRPEGASPSAEVIGWTWNGYIGLIPSIAPRATQSYKSRERLIAMLGDAIARDSRTGKAVRNTSYNHVGILIPQDVWDQGGLEAPEGDTVEEAILDAAPSQADPAPRAATAGTASLVDAVWEGTVTREAY
ncbi:hypothetical protein [Sinomonas halotolerans]|uniref:DUF3854 domain-containing protein n=1 Tax=Sinomonas halotolerans TaxID=1644133 RepID=A0ABU9WW27_9MICC